MMPTNRSSTSAKTRAILSVALSPEQREALEARAGRRPISTYAREVLFPANDNTPVSSSSKRSKFADHVLLARILAQLAKSGLAPSLREISRLAQLGALPVTPETEAVITQACRDIEDIKSLLMRALAVRER